MTEESKPSYTFHGVLAGAYKGKSASLKVTLVHASADDGDTALCKKAKAGSLCDEPLRAEELTCPVCIARMAK